MAIETEVLVVGAGPGGYVGAIKLGQLGKKALLVDKDKLGGECLNYGCIPSKALIQSASVAHKARKSAGFDPTAAAEPALEPPGVRRGSWGLQVSGGSP